MDESHDTLATRLRWAREAAGLSRRKLSGLAGLDPSHVRLIEEGARDNPSKDTLVPLADVLDLSLDWLVRGLGQPPTVDRLHEIGERARENPRPVGADHTASDFTVDTIVDPTGPVVVREGFDQTGTEG